MSGIPALYPELILGPAYGAVDYEWYRDRLADPWLADQGIAISVFRLPVLVVPGGGPRRGGYYPAPELALAMAMAVRDALAGHPGFPNLRVRWCPHTDTCHTVDWGAPAPPWDDAARGRFLRLQRHHHPRAPAPQTGERPVKITRVPQTDEEVTLALRYWTRFYSRKDQDCHLPTRFEVQQFQRHLWPAPGQVAVDVGCGRGRFAAALARTGMAVTGYDWAPTAIQQASERYSSMRLRFAEHNFLTAADPAGLEPASVDLVVCRLSLGYLDQKAFLAQAQRWLRPGTGTLHLVLEVTERQPPDWVSLSHRDAEVDQLREGWRDSTRWDLTPNGWLTALALRGPDHS
ncbi:hypothetical protein EES41_39650 (plasmid) [Streptomyces sp. ADI95-16]|uniref:DUF6302 family protein n=1 Tax=Streptomyces sp. ADI95-16 TaxID=1522758 RepID=UPI000F3A9671|nr:DUF6302 family protein [Streptomyces sp. ADI95-16]AYV32890.1 hypothetical protein EES41_39650 [Streptomyces sp. ADI95-16]